MKPSFEDIKKELKMKNINLSHQRLKVLEYLTQNHCHPTVEIYIPAFKRIYLRYQKQLYITLCEFW